MYKFCCYSLAAAIFLTGVGCSQKTSDPVATLPGDRAFVGVSVVDLETGGLLEDQIVVIQDGRIGHIGPAREAKLADGLEQIDGAGKYLAPGLSEMHGHPVSKEDLQIHLANGITTLRAMWGEPSLIELREAARNGEFLAPRLHIAGPIVDGNPIMHFGTIEITDTAQAQALVQHHIAAGYDFIKLYENITLPVFDAITDAALAQGLEVSGHIPIEVPLSHAARKGMRTTEHMFGYLLETELDAETFDLDRWFYVPNAIANLEALGRGDVELSDVVSDFEIDAMVETLAQSGMWTTPTLEVLQGSLGRTEFDPQLTKYLRPAVGDFWNLLMPAARARQSADYVAGFDKVYHLYLDMIKSLHDAGAGILVGTDAPNPGVVSAFAVVDEMLNLSEAGLSNLEVLHAAMRAPAEYLGMPEEFGLVKEGMVADMILLDGDPRSDLTVLRRPAGVMREGAWLDRSALDAILEGVVQTYAAWMEPYADMPSVESPGPVSVWLVSDKGVHLGMAYDESGSAAQLRLPGTDTWREIRLAASPEGVILARPLADTMQIAEVSDSGDEATLRVDGEVIATAPAGTLLLSGTPLDVPTLKSALGDLGISEKTQLTAWVCRPMDACAENPSVWTVTRLEDDAPVGHFYFTGSRIYDFVAEAAGNNMRVWIGGGGYEGQPVQVQYAAGDSWARRK